MELGSEFHLDLSQLKKTEDNVFQYLKEYQAIYTDSGRSALRLLSPYLDGKTILIPEYICESVICALPKNTKVITYPIDEVLTLDVKRIQELLKHNKVEWLYLMHYFGKVQPFDVLEKLDALKRQYQFRIIEDTTHSLFSAKQTIGDYCVASLRKWFPIPDGGVLYCKGDLISQDMTIKKKAASKKVEAMLLKNMYLSDGYDCNAKYREFFVREEHAFDEQIGIYEISDISKFLLNYYSVQELCVKRKENVVKVRRRLDNFKYKEVIQFKETEVPFVLPIYIENRDILRKYLIERNVFCAVHWPLSGVSKEYPKTEWIEEHILSLPIDQRYGKEHMEYLIECLESYMEE